EGAAAADVGNLVDLRDCAAVAPDVIEHQPLAQCEVAQREVLGAQTTQNRVQQHGAADDEIGASWIEPGYREPLLGVEADDLFAQAVDLFGRDPQVAQRGRWPPARGCGGHRAEAQYRSRGADHAIEADGRDLIAVLADLRQDVFRETVLVAARQRVALHETLGEADDADLEAARRLDRRGRAERDLDAAAADVDGHRPCAADVDAIHRGLMDQPRFFSAADDARADAGLALDAGQELAAVAGRAR